jgi:hypothetical protein
MDQLISDEELYNFGNCYTINYGNIFDSNNIEWPQETIKKLKYSLDIKEIKLNRYVIHFTTMEAATNWGPYRSWFEAYDNYGDIITIHPCQNLGDTDYPKGQYKNPDNLSKYILPNTLIDVIKQLCFKRTNGGIGGPLSNCEFTEKIQLAAKDYYYQAINKLEIIKLNDIEENYIIKIAKLRKQYENKIIKLKIELDAIYKKYTQDVNLIELDKPIDN